VQSNVARSMDDEGGGSNAGWIAGFIVIAVVCAIGAGLWFSYHPY
jgi:hypothetical protein